MHRPERSESVQALMIVNYLAAVPSGLLVAGLGVMSFFALSAMPGEKQLQPTFPSPLQFGGLLLFLCILFLGLGEGWRRRRRWVFILNWVVNFASVCALVACVWVYTPGHSAEFENRFRFVWLPGLFFLGYSLFTIPPLMKRHLLQELQ